MRAIGRDPLFVERGEGAELIDVDGNRYVDYVCSWGPLIHGHAHPRGRRRGRATRPRAGTTLRRADGRRGRARRGGRPPRARRVEMLRMTSSGTEASMSAIRLARAATGREKLLKFAGAYHGHVDGLLARGRQRAWPRRRIPASPGVPAGRDAPARSSSRGTTPTRSRAALRRARARRDPRRALPGEHGPRPARRRASSSSCASAPTRPARCSSSTRSSPASASRPAAPRSCTGVTARPDGHGQGPRRRPARRGLRRLARAHGAHRARPATSTRRAR